MQRSDLVELIARLQGDLDSTEDLGPRLCDACVELFPVSGAAIMLMGDDASGNSLGATDAVARAAEDLQFTVGEGPGIEAHTRGRPALEPDLAAPNVRWPTYAAGALKLGVRACFGFPLQVGAARLGALDLYGDRTTVLSAGYLADVMTLADVVTEAVLAMQAHASIGGLPAEIDHDENLRAQVHQASGMISEQLDISIVDAVVRLRAHAYAEGRSIRDVARDVVTRGLTIG
jgi:transcriptional regulator with GAF, ATPase, and Fis domain